MSPKLKIHSKHWKYFYSPPPRTLMWYPEKVKLFFLKMMRVCCIHLFLHVVNSLFYLSSSGSIPRIFLLYGVSKVKDHFIPWAPVGEYVKGPFPRLILIAYVVLATIFYRPIGTWWVIRSTFHQLLSLESILSWRVYWNPFKLGRPGSHI